MLEGLFVGVGISVDGTVIAGVIGCGFGIFLHGRLRKGRGISRQLLLAHTRRALDVYKRQVYDLEQENKYLQECIDTLDRQNDELRCV